MTMPTDLVGIAPDATYYLLRVYCWPAVVVAFAASFFRRRAPFPGVGAVVDVLLEPLHLDLQLEEPMAQLGPAVALARRDVEVRRHAVGSSARGTSRPTAASARADPARRRGRSSASSPSTRPSAASCSSRGRSARSPATACRRTRACGIRGCRSARTSRSSWPRPAPTARHLEAIGEGDELVGHVAARAPAHLDQLRRDRQRPSRSPRRCRPARRDAPA